ncbi:MAG: hypothetical protein GX442_00470 [Candidatus Riflebacteria bacterium]|nr:hypothetical protein [Candidatus Riflebacteria bacterium]
MPVEDIRIDAKFQLRSRHGTLPLVDDTAAEYAEADLENFPPIIVARSDNEELNNLLLAGFTRYRAFVKAGKDETPVEFAEVSTKREAMEIAAGSNSTNGLRPNEADRKLAMIRLDRNGTPRGRIAEILKVSPGTVTKTLGSKRSPEDKKARRAILQDTTLSNKEKASKLGVSPSAISHAKASKRKKRVENEPDQDSATQSIEEFPDENLQHPEGESSGFSISTLCARARVFRTFLKKALESGVAAESPSLVVAINASKKTVMGLVQACKDHDGEIQREGE